MSNARTTILLFETMRNLEEQLRHYLACRDRVPLENVLLPQKSSSRLLLLNLQVWSLKYHLDVSVILDLLLLGPYKKVREQRRAGCLGISTSTLCGRASQRFLEETILGSPALHSFPLVDLTPVTPHRILETPEQMVEDYDLAIRNRRREAHKVILKVRASRRSWRGKNDL